MKPTRSSRSKVAPTFRYLDGGAGEVRVMTLHDQLPAEQPLATYRLRFPLVDTPDQAREQFLRAHQLNGGQWDVEQAYCLILSARRKAIGWFCCATGSVDSCMVVPSQVFRTVIAIGGQAVLFAHTHPSGDPTPGEADVKVSRDLMRAGQVLRVELLDSIVIANPALLEPGMPQHRSLKEMGHLYLS